MTQRTTRCEFFDFRSIFLSSAISSHSVSQPHSNFFTFCLQVIGKFKDEAAGEPVIEFVGLRPKMYSFQMLKNARANASVVEKQRCKGIQRAAQKKLKHADYLEQLHRPAENSLVNRRIGSKLHQLYTWEAKKRGLCAFDDKRFLLEDGVRSLAFGHRDNTARVHNDARPEGTVLVVTGTPQLVIEDDLVERIAGADPIDLARESALTALPAEELVNVLSPPPEQSRAPKRPADALPVEQTLSRPRIDTSSSTHCTTQHTPRYLPPAPEDMHLFVRPTPSPAVSTRASPRYLPPAPEDMHLFVRPARSTAASTQASPRFLPPAPEDMHLFVRPPPTQRK